MYINYLRYIAQFQELFHKEWIHHFKSGENKKMVESPPSVARPTICMTNLNKKTWYIFQSKCGHPLHHWFCTFYHLITLHKLRRFKIWNRKILSFHKIETFMLQFSYVKSLNVPRVYLAMHNFVFRLWRSYTIFTKKQLSHTFCFPIEIWFHSLSSMQF